MQDSETILFSNSLQIFQDSIIIKPTNTYFMNPLLQTSTTVSCIDNSHKISNIVEGMTSESMVDSQSREDVYEYQIDELVWAKIIGYPWWPGIVSHKQHHFINQPSEYQYDVIYQICFFGDQTYAYLTKERVSQYSINRDYFIELATKNRKKCYTDTFTKAVAQADEIASKLMRGNEPQLEEKIFEESSLKEDIATTSSPKSQSLLEQSINKEVERATLKGKPKNCKRKAKVNRLCLRQASNIELQMRQMTIVLYKLLKSKAKAQTSQLDLKILAIELLKLNNFSTTDISLEEKAEVFVLLVQKIKQKTLAELIDLIPANAIPYRRQSHQALSYRNSQQDIAACNRFAQYILIDEFGREHICSDAPREVEIELDIYQ